MEKYQCTYETGGGSKYSDGIWTKKVTHKTITMNKIAESKENSLGIFRMHEIGKKIRVGAKTGNPMRLHSDGTFTIYFDQAGIPYYFERI